MPVNLSIKNVPDALAQRLRDRAAANGRSLQRELLTIIESATVDGPGVRGAGPLDRPARDRLTIEQVCAAARARLPSGTPSSVDFIRAQRDAGLSVDLGEPPGPSDPR